VPGPQRPGLVEGERQRGRAVAADQVEPGQRLVQARNVAGRHPPQHEVLFAHPVEPLPAPAHEVQVRAVAVHEIPQGFQAFPDRHVDHEIGTARAQRGGAGPVAVLQPPHQARRVIGGRVDRVYPGHEVRQLRRVGWRAHQADIELREVVSGHRPIRPPAPPLCQYQLVLEGGTASGSTTGTASRSATQQSPGRGSSLASSVAAAAPASSPSSRARFMPQISGG
jgi:hypothetical protein